MNTQLEDLFGFYLFTTGRRLFAIQQVLKAAKQDRWPELVKHLQAALDFDRNTRQLDLIWIQQRGQPLGAKAQKLDWKLDKTLGSFVKAAISYAEGLDPEDELVAEIETMLKTIAPAGLQAITQLPFVEELSELDRINTALDGDLAGTVEKLGSIKLVKRLTKLTSEFRAELETEPATRIIFDQVRAARARGQRNMLQAVAIIIGRYHGDSQEHVSKRDILLSPIMRQSDEIGAYMKSRRTILDVDPETGEPEPLPAPAESGPPEIPAEPNV
jgi:hypothetical protein